jgi:calcineurin-like phosphoesterase family protein
MNEAIIERWNAVVKPADTVFHLGDVAMGTIAESLPLVDRLNGNKALVIGNHDRIFCENKPAMKERFWPIYESHFNWVMEGLWWDEFLMSHFPYEGDSHEEDRHTDCRPVDRGQWLVHGHVHTEWKIRGRQINVGVDVWDFTPVHFDQIMEVIGNG